MTSPRLTAWLLLLTLAPLPLFQGCRAPVGVSRGAFPAPTSLAAAGHADKDLLLSQASACYQEGLTLRSQKRTAQAREAFAQAARHAWDFLSEHVSAKAPATPQDLLAQARKLHARATLLCLSPEADERSPLPFASLTSDLPPSLHGLSLDTRLLNPPAGQIATLQATENLTLRGLTPRVTQEGFGTPLIASLQAHKQGIRGTIAVTALLRWDASPEGLAKPVLQLVSTLSFDTVELAGASRPLAFDLSAPGAWSVNSRSAYYFGRLQFFRENATIPTGLYADRPHRKGRIPVLFVHGTLSSPITWLHMVNQLYADPLIRERYEFWFFNYDSSHPIASSAGDLRAALAEKLRTLQEEGPDEALNHIVAIGHSQGGLLLKLQAINPGNALWEAISDKPFDSLSLKPEIKQAIAKAFFMEANPKLERLIFIATPHRGSVLSKGFVRSLVGLVLEVPKVLTDTTKTFLSTVGPLKFDKTLADPTSLSNMAPDNPWLLAISAQKLAPHMHGHSIVAVKSGRPAPGEGDGVVNYESSHVEEFESEKVIKSDHGVHRNPEAIAEVHRLLLLHLQSLPPMVRGDH